VREPRVAGGFIEAKDKLTPYTLERCNYGGVFAATPVMKRSKLSSKLPYEFTNNPLPMSVIHIN
jgi:hypothetical protein